jgi:hypothetical protein
MRPIRGEHLLAAVSVAAWVYIIASGLASTRPVVSGPQQLRIDGLLTFTCAVPFDSGATTGLAGSLWHWSLMVAAAMLPLTIGRSRWLAWRSLASRRLRVVLLHSLGFMAIWVAAGAVLVLGAGVIGFGQGAAVALLVGAAVWHVSPRRQRLLRRCGSSVMPAITGWRGDRDCVQAGVGYGRRCLSTCGVAMAPMAFLHSWVLMSVVAVILFSERRSGPNPEAMAGRPREGAALMLTALLVAVGAPAVVP